MHSLKFKISAIAAGCVVVLVAVLSLFSYLRTTQMRNSVEAQSTTIITELVLNRIKSSANYQAAEIASQLQSAQQVSQTLAAALTEYSRRHLSDTQLRNNSIGLITSMLQANKNFLGLYAAYEPNSFDNSDALFINDKATFSDASGRFIPYVSQIGSDASVEPLLDYENQSSNGNGARVGEYYLCPKDSKETCITDPYLYPIGGVDTLLTSVTSPVIIAGKFQGIAGVDIGLKFIQQFANTQNQGMYNGSGSMAIVSQNNIVVGFSGQDKLLGSRLDAGNFPQWSNLLDAAHNDIKALVINEKIYAAAPIIIQGKSSGWTVLMELPYSVASTSVQKLDGTISSAISTVNNYSFILGVLGSVITVLLIGWLVKRLLAPVSYTVKVLQDLAEGEGDLTARLSVNSRDEIAEMASWLNQFLDQTHNIISQMGETSKQLSFTAESSFDTASASHDSMQLQQRELDMTAAAVQEMSASANEVATNASNALSATEEASNSVDGSKDTILEAVETINLLEKEISFASDDMQKLSNQSDAISNIIVTIQGIAEQTNLLALNAAIEAARAGETGRGFAVVADEVRLLAKRTQDATGEIQSMIEKLQSDSLQVSSAMEKSKVVTQSCVTKVHSANEALNTISGQVNQISSMSQQISVAAHQQSTVATEISKNISNVGQASASIGEGIEKNNSYSKNLNKLANEMNEVIQSFKL